MTEEEKAAEKIHLFVAQTMSEGTRAAQLLDTTAGVLGIRPGVKLFAGFYLAIMAAYAKEHAANPEIDEQLRVAFNVCLKHVHAVVLGEKI